MKVKDSSYLRSLTALLRPSVKNSFDQNEECDPWYVFVPSVTYLWTRKPQWRRRHKKRKKSKTSRFPTSTSTRVKESDLSDTFRIIERPISRSSTSPYETCSSRQIVTESESSRCDNEKSDREILGFSLNHQLNSEQDRNVFVSESRSDSGLRKSRELQLIRTIRSQKRLGNIRNLANGQTALEVHFDSTELQKSIKQFAERDLQSDCSIPKRRVTFRNYVSKDSLADKKYGNNDIRMTDNDTDWWQESYKRLTDDEDDMSLQTNVSRLFSSMIFDLLSSKSSLSLDSSRNNSDRRNSSSTKLGNDKSESIFYINSSYAKESSSDFVSMTRTRSTDGKSEFDKFISHECDGTKRETENANELMKDDKNNILDCNFKKSPEIDNDVTYHEDINSGKDIVDHSTFLRSSDKKHVATDTSDLVELNFAASSHHVDNSTAKSPDKVEMSVIQIIDFLRRPANQIDSISFKQLSTFDDKTIADCRARRSIEIDEKIEKPVTDQSLNAKEIEKIDLLRIETEIFGEYETISIEMKDVRENFQVDGNFKEAFQSGFEDHLEKQCEPIHVDLPTADKNFRRATASNIPNVFPRCSDVDKCCLICGRTKIDNPRYLRPVCRVKGVMPIPRLENDPWINVMNKVVKRNSRRRILPEIRDESKNKNATRSTESSIKSKEQNDGKMSDGKDDVFEILSVLERERNRFEKKDDECFDIIITEADAPSMEDSNIPPSRDQSTSCAPSEHGYSHSSSQNYASRLRVQSAKTYYMRESVRTVDVTANRLLCVISESNSLMGLPQFLPKKPPDWFARQAPRKKWLRR